MSSSFKTTAMCAPSICVGFVTAQLVGISTFGAASMTWSFYKLLIAVTLLIAVCNLTWLYLLAGAGLLACFIGMHGAGVSGSGKANTSAIGMCAP
jgi:hypothetical protein